MGKIKITDTTIDDVYQNYSFDPTITRQEIEDLINRGIKANLGALAMILPNSLQQQKTEDNKMKLLNEYRKKLIAEEEKIVKAEAKKIVEAMEKQIKFRQEVSDTMSSTMLEHAKTVIRFSHTNIQDQTSYTVACMLKGFSIEYMVKMIGILTKNNYVENKSQKHNLGNLETINEIFREYKDDVNAENTTGTNLIKNGHEINDLLLSLPEPIANLIRYKALVNLSDDTIIRNGNINAKKINAADYLVMTCCSDFPKEIENQNEVLKKNNTVFVSNRYIQTTSDGLTYEMLNSIVVATYMVLENILESEKYKPKNIPNDSYKSIEKLYSEELDELIQNNPNKKQFLEVIINHLNSKKVDISELYLNKELMYILVDKFSEQEFIKLVQQVEEDQTQNLAEMLQYAIFFKKYLSEIDIKLNDKKYKNINKLFKTIRDTNDIQQTGNLFMQWYQSIDINELTPEELKELQVISPKFIYNNLNYTDKLIYKKCESKDIRFAFYYKININTLLLILDTHAKDFKGKFIGENCIRISPEELNEYSKVLKKKGLSIGTVPDYYFLYSPCFIDVNTPNQILSQEEMEIIKLKNSFASSITRLTPSRFELNDFGTDNDIIRINEHQEYNTRKIMIMENLISLINLRNITDYSQMQSIMDVDRNTFYQAFYISKIQQYSKISDISPYINMSDNELLRLWSRLEKMQNKENEIEHPQTQDIRDIVKRVEVKPNMKFVNEKDYTLSYLYCQRYQNQRSKETGIKNIFPVGEHLLYATPEEVKRIVEICSENEIDIEPEFLYFSPEQLEKMGEAVKFLSQGISSTKGKEKKEFTSEDTNYAIQRSIEIFQQASKLNQQATQKKDEEIELLKKKIAELQRKLSVQETNSSQVEISKMLVEAEASEQHEITTQKKHETI